ncbi:MAG: hypothetical protein CVV51_07620 [Spirochaetae bacterium HGW-Spirochaetae-7]|jgi:NAD(P)-dependent dehydrogenase (short-subunit alcohol dehydrogenase family)|nr:MAG: hypothetical protein CVV51_07620 [Spirochaetae bacterium HGW-Spirochaetae-7]
MKRMALDGAVVALTGAGSGIGREIALALGAAGARVALLGRRRSPLEETAAAMPPGAIVVVADATDPSDCLSARNEVLLAFGKVDILINNAGVSMRGEFGKTDPTVFKALVDGNLLGPMLMTRTFMGDIASSRGAVSFVSSLAGLYGLPEVSAYSASKMGLTALAQSLRTEYSGSGCSFTVVHVGLVDNDPDKRVFAADGSMVPLSRPSQATRRNAAAYILECVTRRKATGYHTPTGKVMAFVVRLAPGLVRGMTGFSRRQLRKYFD